MKRLELIVNLSTIVAAASALAVAVVVIRRDGSSYVAKQSGGALANDAADRRIPDWQRFERGGHRMGPSDAKVTILEFGDFECPACGAFASAARKVLPHHKDEVSVVFRHWPLAYHRLAYPAARAAECAGNQGRFAQYHDLLYSKQDSLGLISFAELAERAGVGDMQSFESCTRSSRSVPAIDSGTAAARSLGARGTPTLIVNGVLLSSVPDSTELESLISEAKKRN